MNKGEIMDNHVGNAREAVKEHGKAGIRRFLQTLTAGGNLTEAGKALGLGTEAAWELAVQLGGYKPRPEIVRGLSSMLEPVERAA